MSVGLSVFMLATVAIAPVAAIRYGDYDNNDHPYVGLMVAQTADGVPLWRCTGTLMSSTSFLTAGHCVDDPAAHVEIWFWGGTDPLLRDPNYPAAGDNPCAGINGYPCKGDVGGDPIKNPNWDPAHFWLYDVGMVTWHAHYNGVNTYGQLPSEDQLDSLHAGRATWFTAVGYGLQAAFPDAASWKDEALRVRMVAYPWLHQVNTNYSGPRDLILSDNAAAGGTCFGDSGGPNFLGSSRVVAAVNSFVLNSNCAGLSGAYRIDRAADLEWIQDNM